MTARARAGRTVSYLANHPTRRIGLNWTLWVLALIVVVAIASGSHSTRSSRPAEAAATPLSAGSPQPDSGQISGGSSLAPSIETSTPYVSQTTGGPVLEPDGGVLPNPSRTPGAVNAAVMQASIAATICVPGWTSTVRPPTTYTTRLKEEQLANGYAYNGDTNPADYEEDHLIPLELGGSPDSELNLWPEPYAATDGARTKDVVENRLHSLVCAGTLSLAVAQHAIATDWYAAYRAYVSAAPVEAASSPASPPPAASPSGNVTTAEAGPPAGATALCNDGTYSYAAHHQGACSHHGGVAIFYK